MQTIVLHAFAHGGFVHVALNAAALVVLGGPLISQLGRPPVAWFRFAYLFTGSVVCGAILFLLFNRDDHAVLIGASGGLFGILGALARVNPMTGESVPVYSTRTLQLARFFVVNHAALFLLVVAFAFAFGSFAMVAWEAHLGGLLFGFLAATFYLKSPGG